MARKTALTPEEAKLEALGTALSAIEHKYGKGAVMKLSDNAVVRIPVIPTGSIGLDMAPGGRFRQDAGIIPPPQGFVNTGL